MAKKRRGANPKNKPNAAKENKPGLAKEIKHVPAEESKKGSTEGIKRVPAEESKKGSTEGIKRVPVEESKQGSAGADDFDFSDEISDFSEEETWSDFGKKIERVCEKALDVFVDGIVEVLIFLEKRYKYFQKCIQNINFVTFFLFKSVLQCYMAVHFTHVLVYLLDLTGMRFEFPLEHANHFITNFRDCLAWDFKLFVLIVTIISFINDLINTGHHGKNHVDGIWIILLAEFELFLMAPLSDHFGDYLLMALVAVTVSRLMFEVCYDDYEDLNSSLDFIPLLVFTQLIILVFCAFLISLYEASKFLEKYVPDISSADGIF